VKKIALTGIGLALVVFCVTGFAVYAQQDMPPIPSDHGMKNGPMGMPPPRPLADLNLTDEQKEKLAEINKSTQSTIEPLQQQIVEKKKQLLAAVLADNPDKAKIATLTKELNALRSKAVTLCTDTFLKISKTLTPEQSAKLSEWVQHSGSMGMRMGMPMGGMQGRFPGQSIPGPELLGLLNL